MAKILQTLKIGEKRSTDSKGNWGKYHSACSSIKKSRKKTIYYQNKEKFIALLTLKFSHLYIGD